MRSEIFDLTKTTTLVATFPLTPKPEVSLALPVLGIINFAIPLPLPAQTLPKDKLWELMKAVALRNPDLKKGWSCRISRCPDTSGKITHPSDLEASLWYWTFLSIWSPPSVEQALTINSAYQSLDEKQAILAIFLQDSAGEVETFMKRGNYTFAAVVDKDGGCCRKLSDLNFTAAFFVNSKGIISDTFTGVLNKEELLEKLKFLD